MNLMKTNKGDYWVCNNAHSVNACNKPIVKVIDEKKELCPCDIKEINRFSAHGSIFIKKQVVSNE